MKKRILDAAFKIFSKFGYHNAKVAVIAHEADVAVGTIYKWFNSKEELYKAVVKEKLQEMEERIFRAIEDKPPVDALRAYIHESFAFFEENKDFLKSFLQDIGSFSVVDLEKFGLSNWYENFIKRLAQIIDNGVSQGLFKKIDSELVMTFISGGIRNLVYSEAKGRINCSIASIEETVFNMIIDGIGIKNK